MSSLALFVYHHGSTFRYLGHVTKPLLNLEQAPDDALKRLLWLSGVAEQAKTELEAAYRLAYYDARLEQRIHPALGLGLHGKKRVLAWTRAENESRGRSVRWGDGLRD